MVRSLNWNFKKRYARPIYRRSYKKKAGTKFSRAVVGNNRFIRSANKRPYARARLALRYGMRRWRSARNRRSALAIRAGRMRAMRNYARAIAIRASRMRGRR